MTDEQMLKEVIKEASREAQVTMLPFHRMPVSIRLQLLVGILGSFLGFHMTIALVREPGGPNGSTPRT